MANEHHVALHLNFTLLYNCYYNTLFPHSFLCSVLYFPPFSILKEVLVVQIDSDKTVMVTFKHDDKLQENLECGFQVMMRWNGFFFILFLG